MDTVTVFIALMVLGRWAQARAVERSRARLLDDDGAEGLLVRRAEDGQVRVVPAADLEVGDEVVLAPGELCPVDLALTDEVASCSLDWIDGESRPRLFEEGAVIPAGAFNVGLRPVHGRAAGTLAASGIARLLTRAAPSDEALESRWWQRVSGAYVGLVLLAGAAGFVAHGIFGGDAARGLEVATAIMVVTCPCAFGIAVPLAHELASVGLRGRGVFVRGPATLDRASEVRHVVFDKTGTLTTGRLQLADVAPLERLSDAERAALYSLVAANAHPKGAALRRALERLNATALPEIRPSLHAGRGVTARIDGRLHSLGSPGAFEVSAASAESGADLVYAIDGRPRAQLRTTEEPRHDAAAVVKALRAGGRRLSVSSGDAPARVARVAAELGLDQGAVLGGQSPEDKAAFVARNRPEETLMLGDGLNDRLAMERALCSGTPALGRPFVASRADFYFVTPGLDALLSLFAAAKRLRQVVRANLAFALAYNAGAVSLALMGLMRPWLAATLMPLSSITAVAFTAASLSRGGRWWR